MTVEMICCCQEVTADSHTFRIAGFDELKGTSFPLLAEFSVFLKLRWRPLEQGQHVCKISIVGPTGSGAGEIQPPKTFTTSVQMGPGELHLATVAMVDIRNLQIPQPGNYQIRLLVNNVHESSTPLTVTEVAAT
jgi:hypothetical protein